MIARCFLALELGDEARRAADDALRSLDGDVVRKAKPGSLHITIKFLGQVDVDTVGREVLAVAAPIVARSPRLALGTGRVEGFPSAARARVVVLECDGADARIAELAARADEAATACGVAREERAFRPQVTLARSKNDFDLRKIAARFAPRPLGFAGKLVLFESAASGYVPIDSVG